MRTSSFLALSPLILAACGAAVALPVAERTHRVGMAVAVTDTMIVDAIEAAGVAAPIRSATLSTRLMATVVEVSVHEGDRVAAGDLLVRLDARDLVARREQVEAALAEARAVEADAESQASRIRALYADSAATRAQLDQAETGLARAVAAMAAARGMAAELVATASYAEVRAPFAGIVTRRLVDPGSFAAPGSPLLSVEDPSRLRVSVSAAPDAVRGLRKGGAITASIGESSVRAVIEGVVPSGGNLYTVNALVANLDGRYLSGSAATLALPRGTRRAILIPSGAIGRQGDLTGVQVVAAGQPSLRWVKAGLAAGGMIEILSGLAPGDSVLVAGDRS